MDNNYFDKLYPLVMEHMIAYKDDFLVCDRKLLAGYSGSFILGYRDSGTNILLLCQNYAQDVARPVLFGDDKQGNIEQLIANVDTFLFSNEKFILGEGGNIYIVEKEKAQKIFRSWLPLFTGYLNQKAA